MVSRRLGSALAGALLWSPFSSRRGRRPQRCVVLQGPSAGVWRDEVEVAALWELLSPVTRRWLAGVSGLPFPAACSALLFADVAVVAQLVEFGLVVEVACRPVFSRDGWSLVELLPQLLVP